MAHLIIK